MYGTKYIRLFIYLIVTCLFLGVVCVFIDHRSPLLFLASPEYDRRAVRPRHVVFNKYTHSASENISGIVMIYPSYSQSFTHAYFSSYASYSCYRLIDVARIYKMNLARFSYH